MLSRVRGLVAARTAAARLLHGNGGRPWDPQGLTEALVQHMDEDGEPAAADPGRRPAVRLPAFPSGRRSTDSSAARAPGELRGRRRWSPAELEELARVVAVCRSGNGGMTDWAAVLPRFPGRSRTACVQALFALRRRQTRHDEGAGGGSSSSSSNINVRFSAAEDSALAAAVHDLGERRWDAVAARMERETGVRRRVGSYQSRWFLYLYQRTRRTPGWTGADTARLRDAVAAHGPDPIFLAYRFFPGYSPPLLRRALERLGTAHEGVDPRTTIPHAPAPPPPPPHHHHHHHQRQQDQDQDQDQDGRNSKAK